MDYKRVREFEQETRSVYLEVFKALSWTSLAIGLVLLLALQVVGTVFYNWLRYQLQVPDGVLGAGLAVIVTLLFWLVKRNPPRFEVELHESKHTSCQALVLPLSPPSSKGGDCSALVDELLTSKQGTIADPTVRRRFGGSPWRVPIESIAYQLDRPAPPLRFVIVVASTRTVQYQSKFEQVVRLLSGDTVRTIHITSLGAEFQAGVEYLSPQHLSDALVAVNGFLKQQGIPDPDVILDVTSGNSLVSVLFTAAAYRRGRRIQYVLGVDGEPYSIRIWAPLYRGPGTGDLVWP